MSANMWNPAYYLNQQAATEESSQNKQYIHHHNNNTSYSSPLNSLNNSHETDHNSRSSICNTSSYLESSYSNLPFSLFILIKQWLFCLNVFRLNVVT